MIFIDCREGVSSDMLLSAMLALADYTQRRGLIERLVTSARANDVGMSVVEIEDAGDRGLGISYTPAEARHGTPYREAASILSRISASLGSGGDLAMRILDEIARAESTVHGETLDDLHLHEVGRREALITLAGIGFVRSAVAPPDEEFICSTITTGKGVVVVSHGPVRVPAPAARVLLEGLRHVEGPDPGERATPSGIAALKTIVSGQSDDIPNAKLVGFGFGTRRFGGRLGRVRLLQT
ncbi:MAG: nickel insertion protein [Thermoplasmata archaeon]